MPDDDPGLDAESVACDVTYEPVYASLRDALLQPERVVKMPVYFLRWLPYVGARTIFEVVGIWQEYYLSSRGKQPVGGEKVATRIENVCRWAGVSRAQLFRDFGPGSLLNWFLGKIETDHERDRRTGRSKKSANKYALYAFPHARRRGRFGCVPASKDIQRDPANALRAALPRSQTRFCVTHFAIHRKIQEFHPTPYYCAGCGEVTPWPAVGRRGGRSR